MGNFTSTPQERPRRFINVDNDFDAYSRYIRSSRIDRPVCLNEDDNGAQHEQKGVECCNISTPDTTLILKEEEQEDDQTETMIHNPQLTKHSLMKYFPKFIVGIASAFSSNTAPQKEKDEAEGQRYVPKKENDQDEGQKEEEQEDDQTETMIHNPQLTKNSLMKYFPKFIVGIASAFSSNTAPKKEKDEAEGQRYVPKKENDQDEGQTYVPKGIMNVGNTCFFNAALQVLMWSPFFKRDLKEYQKAISTGKDRKFPLILSLIKLNAAMEKHGNVPKVLIENVLKAITKRYPEFGAKKQEDSLEVFLALLSTMKEELQSKEFREIDGSPVEEKENPSTRRFKGHTITVYTYKACSHVMCDVQETYILPVSIPQSEDITPSEVMYDVQETYILPVSIPQSEDITPSELNYGKPLSDFDEIGSTGIERGLREITAEEVNKSGLSCFHCGEGGEYTSRTLYIDPPAILMLQIDRRSTMGREKNNMKITYPENLNISPFFSSACRDIQPEIFYPQGDKGEEKIMYKLYAVVLHEGSLDSGHYKSYVNTKSCCDIDRLEYIYKKEKTRDELMTYINKKAATYKTTRKIGEGWYEINDEERTKISDFKETVLSNGNAYLVFYRLL